jgi:hypothetical protein
MGSEAKAAQPSGRSVLEELDSRIPTGFYWYLAVLACIGGFLFGLGDGVLRCDHATGHRVRLPVAARD